MKLMTAAIVGGIVLGSGLVFTSILVPATKQLALRMHLDESGRARADVPELRLVYKLQPSTHSAPGSRH